MRDGCEGGILVTDPQASGVTYHANVMSSRLDRATAWAVHLLTASGAAWGFLALVAIADGRLATALGWMLLALLVDGVDGTLARRFHVAEVLPRIDGALLDNLIDYLNYAVVPAFLLYQPGLLPEGYGLFAALFVCLASAFQFTHPGAKSPDHMFRGFPSYWNVVAFYLLLLGLDPRLNFAIIVILGVLSFAPIHHVYPSRTPTLRPLTLVLTGVWGACLLLQLVLYPRVEPWVVHGSLAYVVYYFALSFVLTIKRRPVTGPLEDK